MGVDAEIGASDLDILRQIRNANPNSQLPALWLDSEDPYTQWEGVIWDGFRVLGLQIPNRGVISIPNIKNLNKLIFLGCYYNQISSLDLEGLIYLEDIAAWNNDLQYFNIAGCISLTGFSFQYNLLSSIPSLTNKNSITGYNFRYNNFPTSELDRFRAMGFTDESKLLPQNP